MRIKRQFFYSLAAILSVGYMLLGCICYALADNLETSETKHYVYNKVETENIEDADCVSYNVESGTEKLIKIETSEAAASAEMLSAVAVTETQDGAMILEGTSPSVFDYREENAVVSPNSIIGDDGRSRITATSSYPYSAICYIESIFDENTIYGTAFIYSNGSAVTAGHCVYDESLGGWAKSVKVYPGQNGSSSPYGSTTAKNMVTSSNYISNGSSNYDWAILELNNSSIGASTGTFGIAYYSDSSDLEDMTVKICGYPGEKNRQMWGMYGKIASCTTYRLKYTIDTTPGQSGSPIFQIYSRTSSVAVGIHTFGSFSKNSGVRITKSLYDTLLSYR